jgi:hypothetical protein
VHAHKYHPRLLVPREAFYFTEYTCAIGDDIIMALVYTHSSDKLNILTEDAVFFFSPFLDVTRVDNALNGVIRQVRLGAPNPI